MTAVEFGLLASASLFSIINPLAAIPAFFAMTTHNAPAEKLRMAQRACLTCALVLVGFGALGKRIFGVFGITLPSFQIAGGLILLLVSLDNLRATRSPVQETAEETEEGVSKEDISITPLAIPMLSGPGAITTTIVLETRAHGLLQHGVLFAAIALVSGISYALFRIAITGAKRLNPIAMNITTRLMGLMLAATAVEFIVGALRDINFVGH
jgi:multiple antibiotic resistance protein